ncbi:hypothetical protein XENOCAPTIV_001417, partial [Xenoophorus captivus]
SKQNPRDFLVISFSFTSLKASLSSFMPIIPAVSARSFGAINSTKSSKSTLPPTTEEGVFSKYVFGTFFSFPLFLLDSEPSLFSQDSFASQRAATRLSLACLLLMLGGPKHMQKAGRIMKASQGKRGTRGAQEGRQHDEDNNRNHNGDNRVLKYWNNDYWSKEQFLSSLSPETWKRSSSFLIPILPFHIKPLLISPLISSC